MTATDDRPATEVDETTAKRRLAARQIVLRLLADEVAAEIKKCRDELEPKLLAKENVAAQLPDGTVIGQVSRSKPRKTPTVTDAEALLAWVEKNRAEEVVVTKSVRTSFVDALKAQAKEKGWAYDVTTGEIIPGIEMVEGSSSYLPKADEDAGAIVMPQLLDLLAGGILPQLSRGQ